MNHFFSIAFFTLLTVAPVQAATTYKQDIPDAIPKNIRDLISESISKAYTRLFSDGGVLECIDKNSKIDYIDTPTVEKHYGKDFVKTGKLFKTQFEIMIQHVKNGAELPPIKITVGNVDNFAYGWGHYGLVHTSRGNGFVQWHGGFEVELNSAKFLSGDSSDVWGGLIAHEMLHNMMHAHEDPNKVGIEKAYAATVFINTAQNCVTNAKDLRDYAGTHRCGGRTSK